MNNADTQDLQKTDEIAAMRYLYRLGHMDVCCRRDVDVLVLRAATCVAEKHAQSGLAEALDAAADKIEAIVNDPPMQEKRPCATK